MNIDIGIGFGEIKLGMTESEAISLLGKPDKKKNLGTESDYSITCYYYKEQVKLSFDKYEDFKLSSITIYNDRARLFGHPVLNISLEDLTRLLERNELKVTEVEDYESFESLYVEDIETYFTIEINRVRHVEISALFEDEE